MREICILWVQFELFRIFNRGVPLSYLMQKIRVTLKNSLYLTRRGESYSDRASESLRNSNRQSLPSFTCPKLVNILCALRREARASEESVLSLAT
jgi:hypothetical protein